MRRLTLPLLLLALCAAPASWAQDDAKPGPAAALPDPATARQELVHCYAQIDAAIGRKDSAQTVSYLDPNYVSVGPKNKRHNVWQTVEGITYVLGAARALRSTTHVAGVQRQDDGYVAQIGQQILASGRDVRNGRTVHVIETSVQRDYWIHDEDGWHLKRSRTLSDHTTVNGRPYQVNGRPFHPVPKP